MNSPRSISRTLAALGPACLLAVCLASASEGAAELAPDQDGGFEGDAGVVSAPDAGESPAGAPRPEVITSLDAGAASRLRIDALLTGLVEGVSTSASLTEVLATRVDATVALSGPLWVRGTLAANLVVADKSGQGWLDLKDTGTAVTVGFASPESSTGEVSLSLQPFGSARLRPTFDWADAWGQVFSESALSPTFVAQWLGRHVSAWAALRLGNGYDWRLFYAYRAEGVLRPGGLAGVSWWTENGWSLEARAAAYDRGEPFLRPAQGPDVRATAVGLTTRLGWRYGGGVGPAWDQVTYRDDPERFEQLRTPVEERGRFAAQVLLEAGSAIRAFDPPYIAAARVTEPAGFVDLQARWRVGPVRLYATGRARTLSLVGFEAPAPPWNTLVYARYRTSPELSAILGAEGRVAAWLVPGLLVRVKQPAILWTPDRWLFLVRHMNATAMVSSREPVLPDVTATANVRIGPVRDVFFVASLDLGFDLMTKVYRGAYLWPEPVTGLPFLTVTASLLAQVRFR